MRVEESLVNIFLRSEKYLFAYAKLLYEVVSNKGASGVDGVTVEELGDYIRENKDKIVTSIRNKTYIPKPVRGWINYFRIGMMKLFMEEFGEWLRYKIRIIIMKQWKRAKTIYRNLCYLNWKHRNGYGHEEIFKVANSRLGWYRKSGMNVVNFIISKDLLENRIKDGAGLLNPLSYYLVKVGI